MLSEKLKTFCKNKGWWYDNSTEDYANAIESLDIDLSSDFALFYLHVEDSTTFYSRKKEIYQICWFIINTNYELNIEATHKTLKLPKEYIPLDSFEGENGFFYNRNTGEVLELELGQKLIDFQNGKLQPQWKDFNSFLEWYFEIA